MRLTVSAVLLAACLLPATAAEGHGLSPFMLRAGICTPSPSVRESIDGPWGASLGAGWLLGDQGLFGAPSLDGDLRAHVGSAGSQLVGDLTYTERAMIPHEKLWVGGGLGLSLSRYNPGGPGGADLQFGPAGKLLVGGWVNGKIFCEGSFTIEQKLADNALSAAAGIWVGHWF